MTDSYARPVDNSGDATIPIVPDAGYAPTEQLPFAEETLVDPAGRPDSPWSADSGLDLSAPGYGETYASQPPAAPTPQASYPPPSLYPTPAAYTPSNYSQPATHTNYVQPQVAPQPTPYRPTPMQGFAEPSGPADTIGARNFYQGYPQAPTAPAAQQPAWPAVIQDPVSYDYGYSNPANPSDHPNAVLSLVLGLIGLFFFQLLSPVAWYLAAKGKREMAAFPGRWRPSGSLTAGLVLGIIGTVFLALGGMFLLIMLVGLVAMAGS